MISLLITEGIMTMEKKVSLHTDFGYRFQPL